MMLKNSKWDDEHEMPIPDNMRDVGNKSYRAGGRHLMGVVNNDSRTSIIAIQDPTKLTFVEAPAIPCPSELPMSFIDRLPNELTLRCIWPKIIGQYQAFSDKCVAIWSFRAVCSS